jgi:hypothetical protein
MLVQQLVGDLNAATHSSSFCPVCIHVFWPAWRLVVFQEQTSIQFHLGVQDEGHGAVVFFIGSIRG